MREPKPKLKPNPGQAGVITDTKILQRLLYCGSSWVAPYRGPQRSTTVAYWREHAPHLVDPRPEENEDERLQRADTWRQYQGRVKAGTYLGDPEKDLVNSMEGLVRRRREKERFDWLSDRGLIGGEALALIEKRAAQRKRMAGAEDKADRLLMAKLAARDAALGATDEGDKS